MLIIALVILICPFTFEVFFIIFHDLFALVNCILDRSLHVNHMAQALLLHSVYLSVHCSLFIEDPKSIRSCFFVFLLEFSALVYPCNFAGV